MQIKIIDNIDISPILKAYEEFKTVFPWLDSGSTRQSALQHLKDNPSFIDGCGVLKQLKFEGRQLKETDYTVCHEVIKGTIFEEIIEKYNLKRTRLMIIKPKSCYSLHRDFGPRIHIPIITNPSAMFVFKDTGLHHLSTGKVYWVDTTKIHSFANFGNTERLHLIGCV